MNNESGIGVRHVRAHNRSALLRLLRAEGPLSRADLAARSGLSATTITKVVADLLNAGVVAEAGASLQRIGGTRIGRPATDLALVPSAKAVVGVQVGVGTVQLAVCDLLARVRHQTALSFLPRATPDAVLQTILAALTTLLDDAGVDRGDVIGIGIGAPGPVDAAQRVNLLSINLGWRDVRFADHLEDALGIPTVVEHNVRAMAVAEARYGKGREVESLAFVYVRTGVGAGLVMDGQPYRGGTHGVTELGHLRVSAGDRPCPCGSIGCLETVASEGYLTERARGVAVVEPEGALASRLRQGTPCLEALHRSIDDGDPAALAIVGDAARHLGTGLANLVNLLSPQLIVIGGFFADAGEAGLQALRTAVRPQAFPLLRDAVQIEATSFGLSVGVVGAAAVALDRFFYAPGTDVEVAAAAERSA